MPDTELLSFSELLALLKKKSRSTIYELMRRDASFPRPISTTSRFSISWRRDEVTAWLAARPRIEPDGEGVIAKRKRAAVAAA